jgi:hypothetical protein
VGGVLNETTVEELPLNGRCWSDLAILSSGVHTVQNQPNISSTDKTKRGMGLELRIAGGRPQQNNYLMDGVNINNYANAGPGSLLGGNLGTDAVAEFSVLATNCLRTVRRCGVLFFRPRHALNSFTSLQDLARCQHLFE